MCGIAGLVLQGSRAEASCVRTMCAQIRHRGPDDEGILARDNWAIGMRRLSIIDLTTGHQPMSNEDGSVWVVFNGEIYNYRTLRDRLHASGHQFRTESDTEVLVHLYEEEGVEGFKRLRGMFAAATWDNRTRELVLVRDRFGKKPLYWAALDSGLYFGSELKCLQAAGIPLEIDEEALRLYLVFGYVPDPRSIFRAVHKLSPGCWLMYRADGSLRHGRYWTLPAPAEEPPPDLSEEQACEQIRQVFDESVRLRMIADVPLGAFLSGGIDSSLVVASMARQSSMPVKTFSIGFEEARFNELPYARQVAERYHTEHHEILVRPDAISMVERLVRHFDEPFADSSAIPTYLVSEFAARHVKVALSGDGGDELFAGYDNFFKVDALRVLDRIPLFLRQFAGAVGERLPYSAYGKNYLRMISRSSPLERYFELCHFPFALRQRMLEPHWMLPSDEAFWRATFPDCLLPGPVDILTQAQYFEATAKLSGDMLVKVDRMSMAASLEVRSPMLDQELAGLAAKLPHRWKMSGGKGKRILIKALGSRLPAELLNRPKQGFALPISVWFRGPLRSMLWDHLTSRSFQERGVVRPGFVKNMLEEHDSGRRNNALWLWMLLMLELWFRHWSQAPATASVLAQRG